MKKRGRTQAEIKMGGYSNRKRRDKGGMKGVREEKAE